MKRQLSIDYFFKAKLNASPIPKSIMFLDENKVIRKRSLSLKKPVTPNKTSKANIVDNNVRDIIDLCSEDESFTSPSIILNEHGTPKEEDDIVVSDLSDDTVIYSPPMPTTSQIALTPQTPQKLTPSQGLKIRSPGSINKYFSPSKKRAVYKKSPVKKELFKSYASHNIPSQTQSNTDDLLQKACEGMDDKTIFLLTIISKYLGNKSLKCLLNGTSQTLLEKCMHIVKPGMRLVCRLFWYKDSWYKRDKLRSILTEGEKNINKKIDIDDPTFIKVLGSLVDNDLIVPGSLNGNSYMTFEDYTTVLSLNDLKQICKDLKLNIKVKKEAAVEALRTYSKRKSIQYFCNGNSNDNSQRVLKIMSEKAGPCYRLTGLARTTIHKLYVLMYLGINYEYIREKKLELALVYDKSKIETYPIDDNMVLQNASVVFKTNDEFERYIKALCIYDKYSQEMKEHNKCAIVEEVFQVYKDYINEEMLRLNSFPIWLLRFTPLSIYVKILEDGIKELKKNKQYQVALDILSLLISQNIFRQHNKANWYAEKSLVLHKIGQYDEAARVLLDGFKSDLSEEGKDILRPRAAITAGQVEDQLKAALLKYAERESILEKKLRGVHVHKQPMDRTQTRGKLKFEKKTLNEMIVQDVEEVGIDHYLDSGEFTDARHWEGRIVDTLFFLLFWDIIYSNPQNSSGIFLTRFQQYPLDMFYDSFYTNRKDAIDNRLKELQSMDINSILDEMQNIWNSRPETERSGLQRSSLSWADVRAVSSCLGSRALAAVCRRLAKHYRYACSGFPDLTMWHEYTKKIRFVEVKSDTDKPSMKQLQWMHYLLQHGIDTEFCYVGVHTKRSKARAE